MPRGMYDAGSCIEHEKISHNGQSGNAKQQGGVEHGLNRMSLVILQARAAWQLSKAQGRRGEVSAYKD